VVATLDCAFVSVPHANLASSVLQKDSAGSGLQIDPVMMVGSKTSSWIE
jgi:hypothetical protein